MPPPPPPPPDRRAAVPPPESPPSATSFVDRAPAAAADRRQQRRPAPIGRNSRLTLIVGSVVLLVGFWLLLDSLGVPVPPLGRHWPFFLVLGGLASLADWAFVSRRPGSLGQGVVGIGLGILAYLLVFDRLMWQDFGNWWPALFLIAGVAWLATWAADGMVGSRRLTLGLVSVGLAITGWGWQMVHVEVLWAVILLVLGGLLLWRTLRHRRRPRGG